jgi:pilus assembly protein Flp/PilA
MMMNFFRDERGATAIEYALIASLIGMVIIGAVAAIGDSLNGTFNEAAAGLG